MYRVFWSEMIQKTKFIALVTVTMVFAMVAADEHKKPHLKKHGGEERYDKEGRDNIVFDHLSILGSKHEVHEFDELDEDDSIHRLGQLAIKMDRDGNGHVDKEELTHWIVKSYDLLDKEDALDDFKDVDGNDNGRVTWHEYLTHLHTTEQEIKDIRDKKNRSNLEDKLLKEVDASQKKFKAADTNNDEALTLEEYNAFYHPSAHKHMQRFVLEEAMAEHDENKDGKFSFKEFVAYEEDFDEDDKGKGDKEKKLTDLKDERETFDEHDLDKSGLLNEAELLPLLMTDHSIDAEAEAEHLIEKADDDHDGRLSLEEITDYHETFVGHAATGEGDYLHYVKHKDEL